MEQVFEILRMLQGVYIFEILLVAASLLILIDYLFPTDVPAHIGYVCIAAAVFFKVSGSLFFPSPQQFFLNLGIGLAVWVGLAILHRLFFRRFLENAPEAQDYEAAQVENS